MKGSDEKAAEETLRRLDRVLDDDDVPSDEEAAKVVAELGIDIPALAARARAQVDAYEAAQKKQEREQKPRTRVPRSVLWIPAAAGLAVAAGVTGVVLSSRDGVREPKDGRRAGAPSMAISADSASPEETPDAGPDAGAGRRRRRR